MLILHYQDDIDDFHIRDLEMTPKKLIKSHGALLLFGHGEHVCLWAHWA